MKIAFPCKNGLLNYNCMPNLPRLPNIKSLLLKINFSPICYDVINEFYHISRTQCQISNIFAPKLRWKNNHLGNSKKSILNYWPKLVISMCWVTNAYYLPLFCFSFNFNNNNNNHLDMFVCFCWYGGNYVDISRYFFLITCTCMYVEMNIDKCRGEPVLPPPTHTKDNLAVTGKTYQIESCLTSHNKGVNHDTITNKNFHNQYLKNSTRFDQGWKILLFSFSHHA